MDWNKCSLLKLNCNWPRGWGSFEIHQNNNFSMYIYIRRHLNRGL